MSKRRKQRAPGTKQKAARASSSGRPAAAEQAGPQQTGPQQTGPRQTGRFTPVDAALALLLVVWLHAFETMLDKSGYGVVIAWLGTSAALLATWLSVRRRRQGRAPRWAKVTAGIVGVTAAFSGASYAIADGDQAEWPRDETLHLGSLEEHEAGGASKPPAGVKPLVCRSELVVFGRPRGSVERYVGLAEDMLYSVAWDALFERIPADFAEYATLVEPAIGNLPQDQRRAALARAFLQWQFPRQILLIALPDSERLGSPAWGCDYVTDLMTPEILVEDNRLGDEGIYGVTPLFKALVEGELASRLQSYWLIAKYTFLPHDRRDLEDDPYFLLYRGEMTEFERRVNALPQARREFLLKKRGSM